MDDLRETPLGSPCPLCDGKVVLTAVTIDLPHFGPALLSTVRCTACTFRHADTLLTRESAPSRYTLHVASKDALWARVVRSQSGTLRIPELGASVEPGPRSESFITNAEGVLWRFRDIVESASVLEGAESPEAVRTLERIDRMIAGAESFTLIVEDPTGNSAILHPNATKQALGTEEASRLKRGAYVIDLGEAEG